MPGRKKSSRSEPTLAQLRKQAEAAYDAKRWDDVIRLYSRFLERKRGTVDGGVYIRLGNAHDENGDHDRAIEYYLKAIDTPDYKNPGGDWCNMGVACGRKGDYNKAIECFQKAIDMPGYDDPGRAWCNMGVAYAKKGDYDKAIECYQKAIETPGYDSGNAWYSMGNAYEEKGDHDKAIEYYQKAIDTPGYDDPGGAWHNMGYAYDEKGDYDKAIECYEKAIDTPGYDRGGAWNNIGIAYARKGEYDRAIECYQEALDTPGYGTQGHAWYNMGLALRKMGGDEDLAEAERCFSEAAQWARGAKMEAYAEEAEAQAKLIGAVRVLGKDVVAEMFPALSAAQPSQEKPQAYDVAGRGSESSCLRPAQPSQEKPQAYDVLDELQNLEANALTVADRYNQDYEDRNGRGLPLQDALVFLKGWSSSEPFLSRRLGRRFYARGGGLFLRWRGKGVVVDPGIDYLSNFHREKYYVQDIDALVVTHDHIDHSFDLRAIDDVIYQLARFEPERKRYCFLSDPVFDEFEKWRAEGRYERANPFRSHVQRNCDPREHDKIIPGVELCPFPTQHGVEHSFGVKCVLKAESGEYIRVGLTSDTGFFDELVGGLSDCHIIVAHMSSPDYKEYTDPEYLKENAQHLGLNGTRKLIEGTNAQVYVITEFWAGRGDGRVLLCQKLVDDLKRHSGIERKCIIPADVGMTILFDFDEHGRPSFSMKCTSCPEIVKCQEITIVKPDMPFGSIRYLCPKCMHFLTLSAQ